MADLTPEGPRDLLTVKQIADRLSLSIWTVYTLMDDGQLRSVYQGRRRYATPEAIEDYIASLSPTPAAKGA